jgi:hypothetical protein
MQNGNHQPGVIGEAPYSDPLVEHRAIIVRASTGPVLDAFPVVAPFAGFVASHGEQRLPNPNKPRQGERLPQQAEVILSPKIGGITRDLREG